MKKYSETHRSKNHVFFPWRKAVKIVMLVCPTNHERTSINVLSENNMMSLGKISDLTFGQQD